MVTGQLRAPGLSQTYRAMVARRRRTHRLSDVLSPIAVEASLRRGDVVVVPNPLRHGCSTVRQLDDEPSG